MFIRSISLALTLVATIAVTIVCWLKIPHQIAFQMASGEEFTFQNLDSVKEVKLSTIYQKPYFKLFIDYNVAPFEDGYHNLFQTSDANNGLRMEFTNRISAIVYATSDGSNGFAVQIHNLVRHNHRQTMTIRAIDGRYVWVEDSETGRHFVASPIPHFSLDHILLGQGFDTTRVFLGKIYQADLSVCEYPDYRNWMITAYTVIGIAYLTLVYFALRLFFKRW